MGDIPHRNYARETGRFDSGLKQPPHVPSTDSTLVANGTLCGVSQLNDGPSDTRSPAYATTPVTTSRGCTWLQPTS